MCSSDLLMYPWIKSAASGVHHYGHHSRFVVGTVWPVDSPATDALLTSR